MRVPKIFSNSYVKQFGLFACLAVPIVVAQKSCDNNAINTIKSEIKTLDPARYEELKNRQMLVLDWQKELESIKDSIYKDSIQKEAYNKAVSVVLDSINRNNIIKIQE